MMLVTTSLDYVNLEHAMLILWTFLRHVFSKILVNAQIFYSPFFQIVFS